jgi:hypothetical protein
VVSVLASAVAGLYPLLFGEWGWYETRVLFTSLCVSGMSILTLAGGAAYERGKLGGLPSLGVVASLLGFSMLIFMIWAEPGGVTFPKIALSLVIFGTASGHASLVALARVPQGYRWAPVCAYGTSLFAALLLIGLIWEAFEPGSFVFRLLAADAVLFGAFTILVPVFHRVGRAQEEEAGMAPPAPGAPAGQFFFCPVCGADFGAPRSARARCEECGSTCRVSVE